MSAYFEATPVNAVYARRSEVCCNTMTRDNPWLGPRGTLWGALLYAALLAAVCVGLADYELLDDAYFFKRFAYNLIEHGTWSWNVDDGPIYGNTSQLFQVAATGIYAVTPRFYFLGVKALSCLALVGCLAVVLRSAEGVDGPWPWLGLAAPTVVMTSYTGMETALTLFVLVVGLSFARPGGSQNRRSQSRPAWSAFWCWIAYLVRPDAALLLGVPALVAHTVSRREVIVFAGVLPGLLLLSWAGFAAYYGTPLPIAFYWKTGGISTYPASTVETFADTPRNIVHFALYAAPLAYVAAHRLDRRNTALLVGAGLFVAYHGLATLEIMGRFGRFYVPAYAPLVLAAGRGHRVFTDRPRFASFFLLALLVCFAGAQYWGLFRATHADVADAFLPWLWGVAAAGWLARPRLWDKRWVAPVVQTVLVVGYVISFTTGGILNVSDRAVVDRSLQHYESKYRGLETLRRSVQGPLTVYHTDIGALGLYLPDSRIVDLDGLMNPELIEEAVAFDDYCKRDRPHAIFLPSLSYADRRREILASDCIQGYAQVERSRSPLYVREDLAADYRRAR